jgi:nitrate/nitrite transporter NarK
MPLSMEQMEQEISALHEVLEARGINSRKTQDIFGREFEVPVNSEHKATVCNMRTCCSVAQPHMRTFWAATVGFFCTFFSCFAPGALGAYYKRPIADGGLALTKPQLGLAGNLAVTGTILMRVGAGPMCDVLGARKTFIALLLIGIPGMIIFAFSQGAFTFTLGRVLIGLSLATFVTCQVWCSQFFDRSIVGKVNATAGGWGNLGGGITLLTMPYIMEIFLSLTGSNIGTSWRLCMIVPIVMHLGSAYFIWTGRDLPDGSYKQLEAAGAKQKSAGAGGVAKLGFSNTNALIMLITYGLCFGVELTMNNKLSPYFGNYYGMHPTVAGPLASCFSLMNLAARSWGGCLSDACAKKYGLRGRITAMWVVQTLEGLFCILLALVTIPADGPEESSYPQGNSPVSGVYTYGATEYTINGTIGMLSPCSSQLIRSPTHGLVAGVSEKMPIPVNSLVMIKDPAPNCVHNQNTLLTTMLCLICFSICVQMAEGLHFGIVPYISRPALGVVAGMVGAGGNAGALIGGQFVIGNYDQMDQGFMRLGIVIMTLSCIMHFIYFPEEGGILLPPGLPFNPQLIKEKKGQKGSDELDFSKTTTTSAKV